jgi:hypothetical protein
MAQTSTHGSSSLPPLQADSQPTSPTQQAAMTQAANQAAKTGKPVEVTALTTPTRLISAQPKGGFTLADNTVPVRTLQNGAWVPVDTALHKNPDGTYTPNATAYGTVAFSGGGGTTLASTTSGATSYALSWPTVLPAPTVSGSTATYDGVLPGVNLVLTATVTGGFSDVLVVTSPAAASNPQLATLHLPETVTEGTLSITRANGLQVTAAPGGDALTSSTALMWDSNTTPPAATKTSSKTKNTASTPSAAQAAAIAASDPSDATHAGLAAHTAPLTLTATSSTLTIIASAALLREPAADFPEYIDPTLQWHPSGNSSPAYDEVKQGSPCDNVSYYDDAGSDADGGQLGVGVDYFTGGCEGIQRAYYQWSLPTQITGADVQAATVSASEVYQASFNCSLSRPVNLHWTGGIGSGTDYNNQPGYLGGAQTYNVATTVGATYNPVNCQDLGAASASWSLTGPIQQSANNGWGQITVALAQDGDEASGNDVDFVRFADNPTLNISYDRHPNTPSAPNLSTVSGSDDLACATTTPYPYMGKTVASNTPVLDAAVSDPDGDQVQAQYQYWIDGSTSTTTGQSATVASGSTAAFSLPSSFINSLTNGQVIDWKVQVTDGEVWNGAQVWTPWSPTCHITALPTGPNQPTINPNSTYPDTATGGGTGAGADTPATFPITGNTSGASATEFYYSLDQAPATSGTPASEIARPLGTDTTGVANWWKLTDGSGTSTANSATAANTATLSSNGATWTSDPTRGEALRLNGTSGSLTLTPGIMAGSSPLSVHLWFKTTGTGPLLSTETSTIGTPNPSQNDMTVLSIGSNGKLYGQYWNGQNDPIISPNPVNDGTWHEADLTSTTTTQTLYLDGTQIGTTAGATTNNDPLAYAGAGLTGTTYTYFPGEISDIQTYTTALSATQISAMYATNNAALTITPHSPGPHTLYVDAVDAAGDVSGTASYPFLVAASVPTTCASLAACYDNTSISPNSTPTLANADGNGASISATDLTTAGWNSGAKITIDGTSLTLPAYGTGQADNVLAANQSIDYSYTAPTTGISSLMLLVAGTSGNASQPAALPSKDDTAPFLPAGDPVVGENCFESTDPTALCPASGTITYTNGTTQPYYLTTPDWIIGPAATAALTLPHENTPTGQNSNQPKLYAFTIPLTAGQTITSITLPDLTSNVTGDIPALHIYALGTRNTTTGTTEANGTTTATPAGQSWTGSWASDTEGSYNFQGGNFSNQTFRIALKTSVGGSTLRIKLDDALGVSPIDIGAATVALDSSSADVPTPTPAGPFSTLTFAGSTSTVIPQGGMVFSDPLTFTAPPNQWLLVSFQITNTIPDLVQHSFANTAYEYLTATGAGNHTTDTATTAFSATGSENGWFTDLLTGLDVQTHGIPTQVVLGDGLIDAWQPDTEPLAGSYALRLSDDLADDEPSTPQPYGTIAAGIESNQVTIDNPETYGGGTVGGPSVLSRIDRDVLDEPGITNLILFEGEEDILTGTSPTELTSGYLNLMSYLQATYINTDAIGLPPCYGYTGDGETGSGTNANDPCTTAIDTSRQTINNWLDEDLLPITPFSTPSFSYLAPDPLLGVTQSNGEVALNSDATVGTSNGTPADYTNLTQPGYGALANTILGAQDTWPLTDGTLDPSATTANDTADNASAYLQATDPTAGSNPLTLNGTNATNYTWTSDANHGEVLSLDGTTGYGTTTGPVLNTTASFSISAWANLSSLSNGYATIAAQSGTQNAAFYLQYNTSWGGWCLNFIATDTANSAGNPNVACSTTPPTTNTWYHLVGTYNASNHTAQLYINGTLAATSPNITPWNATGPLTLGEGQYDATTGNYFPGKISNAQAWNYALSTPQILALYDQIQ